MRIRRIKMSNDSTVPILNHQENPPCLGIREKLNDRPTRELQWVLLPDPYCHSLRVTLTEIPPFKGVGLVIGNRLRIATSPLFSAPEKLDPAYLTKGFSSL
ncbi:hypothetical protein AVEN_145843-1 [Araneus ventricosus]|uniref:Uncharacterized protein n=1 Tax=Araneus ventricosus TaxID=182803 RepID=A0A4Y2UQP0_ARAVE|nr:hypothetical protein AVEN_145843-1 [Araneus ventricosus]